MATMKKSIRNSFGSIGWFVTLFSALLLLGQARGFLLWAPITTRLYSSKVTEQILWQSSHEGNSHASRISRFPGEKEMTVTALVDPTMIQRVWTTGLLKPLRCITTLVNSLTWQQKILMACTFVLGILVSRIRPFWTRYTDVMTIPGSLFGPTAPVLQGRVAAVTDGDTIRFLHQPTPFHPKALVKGQKLSEYALPIRICTIDTPETTKFGKKGQPFGLESKQALQEFLENKKVFVRLLQKDQYGRAVAQTFVRSGGIRKKPSYVDEHLLKQGLAEVYRGGGAVYGPQGLEAYTSMEEEAKSQKLGIWSQGDNRESAAEYKKRTKS